MGINIIEYETCLWEMPKAAAAAAQAAGGTRSSTRAAAVYSFACMGLLSAYLLIYANWHAKWDVQQQYGGAMAR